MTTPSPILGNQSRPLMTGLAQAGVDLGKAVEDARQAQQEAQRFLLPYSQAANAALAGLRAPGGSFAKKSAALVTATAELQAAQLANTAVQTAAEEALLGAINANLSGYETQLAEMFAAIVDEHQLNERAGYLPDFDLDGMSLSMLDLSADQAAAVLAWREGCGRLEPIWQAVTRLASFQGYSLGPVSDSLWSNRLTSCVLGAVTAAHSMTGAQVLTAWDAGVEQTRQIRGLLPFVVAPISGFPLQLVPVDEADSRLRSFGTVTAPGSLAVGV